MKIMYLINDSENNEHIIDLQFETDKTNISLGQQVLQKYVRPQTKKGQVDALTPVRSAADLSLAPSTPKTPRSLPKPDWIRSKEQIFNNDQISKFLEAKEGKSHSLGVNNIDGEAQTFGYSKRLFDNDLDNYDGSNKFTPKQITKRIRHNNRIAASFA